MSCFENTRHARALTRATVDKIKRYTPQHKSKMTTVSSVIENILTQTRPYIHQYLLCSQLLFTGFFHIFKKSLDNNIRVIFAANSQEAPGRQSEDQDIPPRLTPLG